MRNVKLAENQFMQIPELQDVYAVFDKWMHITDRHRIDAVLAVSLSHKVKGVPLWLIVIAPSGDGKNEILLSIKNNPEVVHIKSLNANALASGQINKKHEDLAKRLDGKIMLIPEMSCLLSMSSEEKVRIWAQLRDLYDGYAGKQTGGGVSPDYSGLHVTFIGGSVPKIDSQILIHQDLGTRELIYRSNGESDEDCKLKDKVFENEGYEEEMRKEIADTVNYYLNHVEIKDVKVPEAVKVKLYEFVDYLRIMRCQAETDGFSGELINFVSPEQATRCLKQIKKLYCCLKMLDPNYTDDRALEVINKIVNSSILPLRARIYKILKESDSEMTTREISETAKIGWKPTYRELNILHALDRVERRDIHPENDFYGKEKSFVWKAKF